MQLLDAVKYILPKWIQKNVKQMDDFLYMFQMMFFFFILLIQRYSMLQAASTAAMKLGLGPPEPPGGGNGKTWKAPIVWHSHKFYR